MPASVIINLKITFDKLAKSPATRHPGEPRIKPAPAGGKPGQARSGVQNYLRLLDSGFRRNGVGEHFSTFCEIITFIVSAKNYKIFGWLGLKKGAFRNRSPSSPIFPLFQPETLVKYPVIRVMPSTSDE